MIDRTIVRVHQHPPLMKSLILSILAIDVANSAGYIAYQRIQTRWPIFELAGGECTKIRY
jgi:hypothetical protein